MNDIDASPRGTPGEGSIINTFETTNISPKHLDMAKIQQICYYYGVISLICRLFSL